MPFLIAAAAFGVSPSMEVRSVWDNGESGVYVHVTSIDAGRYRRSRIIEPYPFFGSCGELNRFEQRERLGFA